MKVTHTHTHSHVQSYSADMYQSPTHVYTQTENSSIIEKTRSASGLMGRFCFRKLYNKWLSIISYSDLVHELECGEKESIFKITPVTKDQNRPIVLHNNSQCLKPCT